MCSEVSKFFTTTIPAAFETVCEKTQQAITTAEMGALSLGRKIDVLTDKILPPTAARIVSAAIKAFPLIIAVSITPFPTILGCIGGLMAYKILISPTKPIFSENIDRWMTTFGTAASISQIAMGVLFFNPPAILWGIGGLIASSMIETQTAPAVRSELQ